MPPTRTRSLARRRDRPARPGTSRSLRPARPPLQARRRCEAGAHRRLAEPVHVVQRCAFGRRRAATTVRDWGAGRSDRGGGGRRARGRGSGGTRVPVLVVVPVLVAVAVPVAVGVEVFFSQNAVLMHDASGMKTAPLVSSQTDAVVVIQSTSGSNSQQPSGLAGASLPRGCAALPHGAAAVACGS